MIITKKAEIIVAASMRSRKKSETGKQTMPDGEMGDDILKIQNIYESKKAVTYRMRKDRRLCRSLRGFVPESVSPGCTAAEQQIP